MAGGVACEGCSSFITLSSPGDAESASMVAGLAVGKPDSGCSIADSALGTLMLLVSRSDTVQ